MGCSPSCGKRAVSKAETKDTGKNGKRIFSTEGRSECRRWLVRDQRYIGIRSNRLETQATGCANKSGELSRERTVTPHHRTKVQKQDCQLAQNQTSARWQGDC